MLKLLMGYCMDVKQIVDRNVTSLMIALGINFVEWDNAEDAIYDNWRDHYGVLWRL